MILASPEPMPISTLRSLMNWKNSDLKDFRRPLCSLLTETEGTLTIENDMLMFVPDRKYFPEVEPGNTYTLETMTDIITTKYFNVESPYEYEVSLNEDGNYVFHIYKVDEKEDGPIIRTVDWITVSPTTGFAYTYKGITFNLSDYVNE